jgi:protein subunit release factor B
LVKRLVLSVSIHDCEVQGFRTGGPGGQNQNKRDTGQRVIHHPSGARAESREERSQLQNKKAAFKRMTETVKFKIWLNRMLMDKTPEERVAEMMDPKNLRVEVQENGKWVDDAGV